MEPIRDRKLIYHLTSLKNLESILEMGLLSRDEMDDFDDVANHEIITFRRDNGLNCYVPFHFFTGNPFDGRVQIDYPDKDFIYITLQRKYAERKGFKIIPMHPKSMRRLEILDYNEGFERIDWDTMECRDYYDEYCKHVCMAECLSPNAVNPEEFFAIYVKYDRVEQYVRNACREILGSIPFNVQVRNNLFWSGQ